MTFDEFLENYSGQKVFGETIGTPEKKIAEAAWFTSAAIHSGIGIKHGRQSTGQKVIEILDKHTYKHGVCIDCIKPNAIDEIRKRFLDE